MLHKHLIAQTSPVAARENQIIWGNRRITVLTDRLFRVETAGEGESRFCDDATQTVWFRDLAPVPFVHSETEQLCVVETDSVRLELSRDPEDCRVFWKTDEGILEEQASIRNSEALPGTYRTLDACNGAFRIPYDGDFSKAYRVQPGPSVVSRGGIAVIDDSRSLCLNPDGLPCPRGSQETDLYLFAYGHDYRAAVKALFRICGKVPVIPRFALGNWWSRYHAYSEKEYLDLMDSFADRGIPFTVATVDMDWHPSHDLPGGEDGWTGYSWNRTLFPDYRRFLSALHDRGYRVTLNLHPGLGVRKFEDMYEAMARAMGRDPESGMTVGFDITDEAFINAYFDVLHKPYEHDGVDFWWIDWQQGTTSAVPGLDPLWSLNHFHWQDIHLEREGLILSRYAGIGSHRYPVGFSGDTHMTWDTLRYLPEFTAQATNIGYTWWSHDIGGHFGGQKDDELYVRFIQFGVFSPINRIHSSSSPMLEKDPAAYLSGYGLIAREFLRLRHAMIPFLYTASRKTAEEGLALMEPMYYGWPEEEEAYRCGGQYLFGQQMIAAPVTRPGGADHLSVKEVWLPEGQWIDFFTGQRYTGPGWKKMVHGLDSFPLLLKEGGFFVLDGAPRKNSIELPETLRVVMAGRNGEYTLVEEKDGETCRTAFRMRQEKEEELALSVHTGRKLSMVLEFRTVLDGEAQVWVNGAPWPCRVRTFQGYAKMELNELPADAEVSVIIREKATRKEKKNDMIMRIMQQIQGSNEMKETVYHRLIRAENRTAYEAAISVGAFSEADRIRLLTIVSQDPM